MNIGVFDSGIGGLTVLKAFLRELPNYTYVYYGDNANAPYGEKSPSEIYDLTIKGVEFLFAKECSLVILACNTASTVLPRIQQEWLPKHYPDRKVLGIIRPTAEHIMQSGEKEIYLMATPATVNAHSYEKELKKLDSKLSINPIPCPGLAKAIEDAGGETNEKISRLINNVMRDLSTSLEMTHCERSLYLACTHYEWVEEEITRVSGCKVVHQSQICAKSLKDYLSKHCVDLKLKHFGSWNVHASRNDASFKQIAVEFLT